MKYCCMLRNIIKYTNGAIIQYVNSALIVLVFISFTNNNKLIALHENEQIFCQNQSKWFKKKIENFYAYIKAKLKVLKPRFKRWGDKEYLFFVAVSFFLCRKALIYATKFPYTHQHFILAVNMADIVTIKDYFDNKRIEEIDEFYRSKNKNNTPFMIDVLSEKIPTSLLKDICTSRLLMKVKEGSIYYSDRVNLFGEKQSCGQELYVLAAKIGDYELIKALIESGMEPRLSLKNGKTFIELYKSSSSVRYDGTDKSVLKLIESEIKKKAFQEISYLKIVLKRLIEKDSFQDSKTQLEGVFRNNAYDIPLDIYRHIFSYVASPID